MEFRELSTEELSKLNLKERKEYLRKKSEYESKKSIDDIINSTDNEDVLPTPVAPAVESKPVEENKVEPATTKEDGDVETTKSNSVKNNDIPKPKKAGRPKADPYVKLSINIPEGYYDLVKIAAAPGSVSSYISNLIEKDLEENKDTYSKIQSIVKH